MKKLFYLFALVYACVSLVSCEEEDNAIKLTINTSVYDVVKDLKDAKGDLYFTDELSDGLRIRVSFLVVKQAGNDVSIVANDSRYLSNISAIASYTTEELEPGDYSVIVTSDFVKGNIEYNQVSINKQYKGLSVECLQSAGVYNAFGTAYMNDIVMDSKKEITLNTVRKGGLVTFLLKNTDKMTDDSYTLTMEKFTYTAYGKFGDDFSYRTEAMQHKWTAGMTAVQHYCAATGAVIDPMTLGWQGDTYKIKLGNGKDVVLELDFATGKVTSK